MLCKHLQNIIMQEERNNRITVNVYGCNIKSWVCWNNDELLFAFINWSVKQQTQFNDDIAMYRIQSFTFYNCFFWNDLKQDPFNFVL